MATKSKAKSKSPASVPTVKLFKVFEGVQAGDIPAYQPGEMILRLTPASQVPPTPANPLGLRVKVLEFLSELTQYGLWRIEPLVQLERRVWETNVVGSPTVDGPPPVVPMALMPPALGPLMQGLYRYLQFGDNASLQQDAVRAGDQWVPVVTVPTRAPGLPVAVQQEVRRRLMLRFDPSRLDEHQARAIVHLAERWLNGGRSALMVDLERVPMRLLADQPYGAKPFRDWTEPTSPAVGGGHAAMQKVAGPVTTLEVKAEDVYLPDWHEKCIALAGKTCLQVAPMVAVLDSGIDYGHPAFPAGSVEKGFPGYSEDYAGHGTHVCAIIAGRPPGQNSGYQYRGGILPQAKLLVFKVMSNQLYQGTKKYYPVDSVRYATALYKLRARIPDDLRVVNLSLGGQLPLSNNEKADLTELNDRGAVVVAAAGNHEATGDFTGVLYPAAYAGTVSVGAYRLQLPDATSPLNGYPYEWEYSNFGGSISQQISTTRSSVDTYAPGRNILAAVPRGATLLSVVGEGYLTGTSMATPLVAGAIAAFLANNPAATFTNVLEMMGTKDLQPYLMRRFSLDDFNVCHDPKFDLVESE